MSQNNTPNPPNTVPSAEHNSQLSIDNSQLEQEYLAARTRAETTLCEVARERFADPNTSTDDVHTLARAIAELKKHDAAIERAQAATRLSDAKIEALRQRAGTSSGRSPEPFNHDEFMKKLRPAIRDIYGLEMPEGFEKDFPITSDCDLTAHAAARHTPTKPASFRQNPTTPPDPGLPFGG